MKLLKTGIVSVLMLSMAGVAFAQTPALTVGVTAPDSIVTGPAQTIAVISLNSTTPVMLNSLPVSLGFGYTGAAPAVPLSSCSLRQGSSAGSPLNTGSNVIAPQGTGDFSIAFDQPFTVADAATLYLTCDVSSAIPDGTAIATTIKEGNLMATTTGGAAVAAGTGTPSAITTIVSSTSASNTGTGSTPGVPNTGAGGNASSTWALLIASALVALGGGLYLMRTRHA